MGACGEKPPGRVARGPDRKDDRWQRLISTAGVPLVAAPEFPAAAAALRAFSCEYDAFKNAVRRLLNNFSYLPAAFTSAKIAA